MIIDLETFTSILEKIQCHEKVQNDFSNFLQDKMCTDSFVCFNFGSDVIDSLIDILELIFKDEGEWISWWLYENVDKVVYIDKKEIRLDTIEALYNFLLDNMKEKGYL